MAIGANLQAKSWWVFAFASLFGYFSRGGWLRSIRRHPMGTLDKQGVVTMQELLVSSLATADALTKLLIEKGLILMLSLCRSYRRRGQ